MVSDHEQEELDPGWAPMVTEKLGRAFEPAASTGKAKVKDLDCRSKTCVARLTFATPMDALQYLASGEPKLNGPGFGGMTSTPEPPTGPGAYDLTIVFTH
jgi:hypothetical protein